MGSWAWIRERLRAARAWLARQHRASQRRLDQLEQERHDRARANGYQSTDHQRAAKRMKKEGYRVCVACRRLVRPRIHLLARGTCPICNGTLFVRPTDAELAAALR